MKRKSNQRICHNYAKSCPIANRCDNCKHRAMRSIYIGGAKQIVIKCRKGNGVGGETDKSKCFECASEGYRCKTGID